MNKFILSSLIFIGSFAHAELPKYLMNISKARVCEKNVGVSPLDLSIASAIRFIANGSEQKAKELTKSDARASMITRNEELCESSDLTNAFEYMTRLSSACEFSCRGTKGCLRFCYTVRDVLLVYLEGVLSGQTSGPAVKLPPKAVR